MYKHIIIKLGTSVLTNNSRTLYQPHIVELVRQCALLYEQGTEIVICTSGAIAAGKERLGFPDLPNTVANKQMFAAVGQNQLMALWGRFFAMYGIEVGQLLLTRADLASRPRFLNAQNALQALLAQRIIPIINENDAVATDEIKVGDNDNLSALAAILAESDMLLLLTDQPGLFTADPRIDPSATLIPEVETIDETLRKLAGGSVSGLGVGGMATKLQAADVARRAGIDVIIAAGRAPDVILRAAAGESVGTRFVPVERPLIKRKQWIFAGKKTAGSVVIDAGAVRALVDNGRSLLPAGIVEVNGRFQRGDTISIHNSDGDELARGITRYNSEDLNQILGLHSAKFSEQLGYDYGSVAIHRNDMILI